MTPPKFCLTKSEIADTLYNNLNIEKAKAIQLVEDYIEIIKEALEKDGKVMISRFGSFEVNYKKARKGRNPKTGDTLILKARKIVKFRPSRILREVINGNAVDENEEE
jgi:nucleoid DNA-binding protein